MNNPPDLLEGALKDSEREFHLRRLIKVIFEKSDR